MYVIIIFKIQVVNLSVNISLNGIEISTATLSNDLRAMASWSSQWKLIFNLYLTKHVQWNVTLKNTLRT